MSNARESCKHMCQHKKKDIVPMAAQWVTKSRLCEEDEWWSETFPWCPDVRLSKSFLLLLFTLSNSIIACHECANDRNTMFLWYERRKDECPGHSEAGRQCLGEVFLGTAVWQGCNCIKSFWDVVIEEWFEDGVLELTYLWEDDKWHGRKEGGME